MESKINVAELLKDCPHGMELDCVLFNNPVRYDGLDNEDNYPVTILTENDDYLYLTEEGYLYNMPNSKCVIFPKGKTTWEGFVPPCKFKNGDIVSTMNGIWIGIVKKPVDNAYESYVTINGESLVYNNPIFCFERFATEEEKARLFQAIKENGYEWNLKTKTLKKFLKFKVGDIIRQKGETSTYTITDVNNAHYFCGEYVICDTCDNDWELVLHKFDITTLIPFESKVLVRSTDDDIWRPAIYGFTYSDRYYVVGGIYWKQCIPYEGNEHLLGTNNDCDKYFKIWE